MRGGAAIAGAALVLLGGCAGGPSAPDPAPARVARERIGLTVESWVIRDQDGALARALAGADRPPAWVDAETAAIWRANGLRLLGVQFDQVAALRASLPTGGPSEIREIGEATDWVALATGPELADFVLRLDNGPLRVGPGRIRLLARSWVEPTISGADAPSVAPRVRIELAPQHAEPMPDRPVLGADPGPRPGESDRGLIFDRLLLSALAPGGEALVLVGESPDADWDAAQEEGEPEAETAGRPDDRVEFPRAGASLHPTLGEALLNASSYAAGSSPLRIVVVLILTPPPDFALLNR